MTLVMWEGKGRVQCFEYESGRSNDLQNDSQVQLYFSIKLEIDIEGAQVKEHVHTVNKLKLSKIHWVTKLRGKFLSYQIKIDPWPSFTTTRLWSIWKRQWRTEEFVVLQSTRWQRVGQHSDWTGTTKHGPGRGCSPVTDRNSGSLESEHE